MAMIRALPEEYVNFTSSVLLLGTLSKSALQDTFYMEETNCRHHAMDSLINEMALLTKMKNSAENAKACRCNLNAACDFCEKPGHCIHDCYAMIRVRKQRKERQAAGHTGQSKDKQNANKALTSPSKNIESPAASDQNGKSEHADKASSTVDPGPFNTVANHDWNADTGASSHMTPN